MSNFRKLVFNLAASVSVLTSPALAQPVQEPERSLSFHNLHTGENLSVTYWQGGRHDAQALASVTHFLRDRLNGEKRDISPALLDTLHDIKVRLQEKRPGLDPVFQVVSGYRSSETNESFRRGGGRVGKKSQHMQGTAIDIRIDGVPLAELRDAAWCLKKGGVGYYPEAHNNFVHVDVARVRFWGVTSPKWKCM